jgi:amino acid adenylation domain-containing protein
MQNETGRQALIEQHLRARSTAAQIAGRIPRRATQGPAPLSAAQKRLWILQQLEPDNPVFNRPLALRLTGELDPSVLTHSISEIVRRHEALRTVFPAQGGDPVQIVLPPRKLTLEIIDLQHLDEAAREGEAKRIAAAQAQKIFVLAEGPLIRTLLLRLAKQKHVLLLLMHHIVFDGWSETVLLRELGVLYDAFTSGKATPLPEVPIHYADFAVWQQERLGEETFKKQLRYWERQLDGMPPALTLPTDYPRQKTLNYRGDRRTFVLSPVVAEQLKELSRRERVTLFMTLFATFQILLGRYARQDDVVVGVPIAGRTHAETEGLIGCFMNVLVMRTDLSGEPTFRELLGRVRDVALQSYAHQEVPFEKVVEVLRPERDLHRWPLFQVMFHLRNLPRVNLVTAGNVHIEPFPFDPGMIGGLDLSLEMQDLPDGLHCTFRYAIEFQTGTIERMAEQFRILLETVVADPDRSIANLSLLNDRERHQFLIEWNDTKREYLQDKCVHQLFEEQVERTPDAVALVFQDQQLTYGELNIRGNQLAHYLRKLGVGPDALVAICVERSVEMIVGLLGILKAGGAYVPLDPSYPRDQLAFMLEDTQVPVLLTQQSLSRDLPQHGALVVCLDAERDRVLANESKENPVTCVTPDNLAYVIYTSGSTGRPKGVMACHRGVCNYLHWRHDYFPLTEADRLLQKASLSFDDSVWEFFEPLTVGARLIMALPGGYRDSAYLVRVIAEQKITAVSFVPSMLQVFLQEEGVERCNGLRRVTIGGEALSVELQERYFARLGAELYNGYGPTEATIAAIFWACKRGDPRRVVPIGRPIANAQIYLLDSHLQPVPIGIPGELHIGGVGLARGYLNRPDLTAERFIPDPFSAKAGARLYKTGDLARYLPDGNIEFLGRMDDQVKIRGYRIELGEIEAMLGQYPAVESSLVVVREDTPGDRRLVAYLVARPEASFNAMEARKYLKQKLPEYMIPSAFVLLNELPLTPNGKVDRKAVPIPDKRQRDQGRMYREPRTPAEKQIERIWADVLRLDKVSIDDNFFDLGGHSLLATQVVTRLKMLFPNEIALRQLFEFPTIAELAAVIIDSQRRRLGDEELAKLLDEVESLSDEKAQGIVREKF